MELSCNTEILLSFDVHGMRTVLNRYGDNSGKKGVGMWLEVNAHISIADTFFICLTRTDAVIMLSVTVTDNTVLTRLIYQSVQ